MDEELFAQLYESVKQMDEIAKGKREPSRVYEFDETDVKAIREEDGSFPVPVCTSHWGETEDVAELGTGSTAPRWPCQSSVEDTANRS